MDRAELSRRDFGRLTGAAVGGIVAGTMIGCGDAAKKDKKKADDKGDDKGADKKSEAGGGENLLLTGKNVCRGLNHTCGNHKDGSNKCSGTGSCHTAKAHACSGQNDCKGEGGCGATAGVNECKGKGKCAVPLKPEKWKEVRAKFEKAMEAAGKNVGAAPKSG